MKKQYLALLMFGVVGSGLIVTALANSSQNIYLQVAQTQGQNLNIQQDQTAASGEYIEFSGGNSKQEFTFTAAGDYAGNDRTIAVLEKIAEQNADFSLALGDLTNDGNGTELEFCNKIKSILGTDYPFQIVAGNHDDITSGDGDIAKYVDCLPSQIQDIDGEYGIQYSFDYNELARFIMITPDIRNYGADYDEGNEHYNWVKDQAAEARELGLQWVFIGMHKNCITPGVKSCEIGEDLLNLAIEADIDVILQGHEHGYFRSKQLNLSTDCPAIRANQYNAACVSDDDGSFTAGEGSVLVISGTGGIGLRDVDQNDTEAEYFSALSAKNLIPTHGITLYRINEQAISSMFVPTEGVFTDSFEILKSASE